MSRSFSYLWKQWVRGWGMGNCVWRGLRSWVMPGRAAVRIAKYLMLQRQAFGVALAWLPRCHLLRTLIHPCCLSDVHLPSFLLMLWGPCYYHLLEQPPSPTWLLVGSDTHAVCNLTVLQTWKCCALSRTKLLLSSEMLSGGFTQLFRLSASWLQRTMCTGKRVSLVICSA